MQDKSQIRPFLKWAGGKRQLLPELLHSIPIKDWHCCKYYEPFLGGGALFFALQPHHALLNDQNTELINCYQVIHHHVEELIKTLRAFQINHTKDYYYKIRNLDRFRDEYQQISKIEKAARIIYLNRTCYNGLFRVNSQGQFNVPYGRYKNPTILDESLLRAISEYLNQNKVCFLNTDFEEAVKTAQKGDFIYFDPPYDPVSETASFTQYSSQGFNQEEQRRLKKVFDDLTDRGCYAMLSNSATDFILDLYQNYHDNIKIVGAKRNINSKAIRRGKVNEVLILNYTL